MASQFAKTKRGEAASPPFASTRSRHHRTRLLVVAIFVVVIVVAVIVVPLSLRLVSMLWLLRLCWSGGLRRLWLRLRTRRLAGLRRGLLRPRECTWVQSAAVVGVGS